MSTAKKRAVALALFLTLLSGSMSIVTANAIRFAVWDTGDAALDGTAAATHQGAIDLFMMQHPGATWPQMQAQGYYVAPLPIINP